MTGSGVLLTGAWIVYGAVFAVHHARTARRRQGLPKSTESKAPEAMLGLLIEGIALFIVFSGTAPGAPGVWLAPAAGLLALGILLAYFAVRELGNEWRIKAVVTEDHRLVRTGPYAFVRHPVYLSLFSMMAGSGLLVCDAGRLLLACAIYAVGTEIRVRAEDRLLGARFGAEFENYRKNVKAWLPPIR